MDHSKETIRRADEVARQIRDERPTWANSVLAISLGYLAAIEDVSKSGVPEPELDGFLSTALRAADELADLPSTSRERRDSLHNCTRVVRERPKLNRQKIKLAGYSAPETGESTILRGDALGRVLDFVERAVVAGSLREDVARIRARLLTPDEETFVRESLERRRAGEVQEKPGLDAFFEIAERFADVLESRDRDKVYRATRIIRDRARINEKKIEQGERMSRSGEDGAKSAAEEIAKVRKALSELEARIDARFDAMATCGSKRPDGADRALVTSGTLRVLYTLVDHSLAKIERAQKTTELEDAERYLVEARRMVSELLDSIR